MVPSSDGHQKDEGEPSPSTVVIQATSPIRSRGNTSGMCALAIGLLLALHTPSWLFLVFYKEDVARMTSTTEDDDDDRTITASTILLRFLVRWLLEFTPWFANAMLSLFLGVLFLYIGFATMEMPDSET